MITYLYQGTLYTGQLKCTVKSLNKNKFLERDYLLCREGSKY